MYKCPFCNTTSVKETNKSFTSWVEVNNHVRMCNKNDNSVIINKKYGIIAISELCSLTPKEIKNKYKDADLHRQTSYLKDIGKLPKSFTLKVTYSDEELIDYLKLFVETYQVPPTMRSLNADSIFPNARTYQDRFGSWKNALALVDVNKNSANGKYAFYTKALDGHLYRSKAEALFCNRYLYNKYKYIIEPKYPEPHNKYFDWYVPELQLYIELDGQLRPKTIVDKIEIIKANNLKCLIVPYTTVTIRKYETIEDLYQFIV